MIPSTLLRRLQRPGYGVLAGNVHLDCSLKLVVDVASLCMQPLKRLQLEPCKTRRRPQDLVPSAQHAGLGMRLPETAELAGAQHARATILAVGPGGAAVTAVRQLCQSSVLMLPACVACHTSPTICLRHMQGTFALPAHVAPALAGLVRSGAVVFRLLPEAKAGGGHGCALEVCLSQEAFTDEAEGPPLALMIPYCSYYMWTSLAAHQRPWSCTEPDLHRHVCMAPPSKE
jgi:hypothetical protein